MPDLGEVGVVVANEREILGYRQSKVVGCGQCADACNVVVSEDRGRPFDSGQQAARGSVGTFLAHPASYHRWFQSGVEHSLFEGQPSQLADLARPLKMRNALVPQ